MACPIICLKHVFSQLGLPRGLEDRDVKFAALLGPGVLGCSEHSLLRAFAAQQFPSGGKS